MKTILDQLLLPYTEQIGMRLTEKNQYKDCGLTYQSDPDISDGFYWIYYFENLFAVTVYSLTTKETIKPRYDHPEYFTTGSYSAPAAQLISDSAKSKSKSKFLLSYSRPEGTFGETIQRGASFEGISITLTDSYVQELSRRFDMDANEFREECFHLNGTASIPEANIILRQMHFARPNRKIAKVYYESKITELFSFIIQWNEETKTLLGHRTISEKDDESFHYIAEYLQKNYNGHIDISTLESIAYMGRSKLSFGFKQKYGVTITEYIKKLRIERAKDLLSINHMKVGEIARMLGYKQQGSFTELFENETGFTPLEYRKNFFS